MGRSPTRSPLALLLPLPLLIAGLMAGCASFEQARALQRATHLNTEAGREGARGAYQSALPKAREALAIREGALDAADPRVAESLHTLAFLLRGAGDFSTARPLYERALRIREQALGPDHPTVADTLMGLAWLLQGQADFAGARAGGGYAGTAGAGGAGPGGRGAAERSRWARMVCTARGFCTAAMTRSRPAQRGQARRSRASSRRTSAAQVPGRGVGGVGPPGGSRSPRPSTTARDKAQLAATGRAIFIAGDRGPPAPGARSAPPGPYRVASQERTASSGGSGRARGQGRVSGGSRSRIAATALLARPSASRTSASVGASGSPG